MGRKPGRRPNGSPAERWRAVQGPYGRWIIVNEHGEQPLTSPNPLVQLEAAYLAAAAPGLKAALEEMTRRMLTLEPPYSRDHQRIRVARGELGETVPPIEEIARAWRSRTQLEFELRPES